MELDLLEGLTYRDLLTEMCKAFSFKQISFNLFVTCLSLRLRYNFLKTGIKLLLLFRLESIKKI